MMRQPTRPQGHCEGRGLVAEKIMALAREQEYPHA
jgi:hypothetical protein